MPTRICFTVIAGRQPWQEQSTEKERSPSILCGASLLALWRSANQSSWFCVCKQMLVSATAPSSVTHNTGRQLHEDMSHARPMHRTPPESQDQHRRAGFKWWWWTGKWLGMPGTWPRLGKRCPSKQTRLLVKELFLRGLGYVPKSATST